MKPLLIPSCIAILLIVSLIAGCTLNQESPEKQGIGRQVPYITPGTTAIPAGEPVQDTSTCPIPPLVINSSLAYTAIPFSFGFGDDNTSYRLPEGSIIEHTAQGITRVYDRTGTQILVANDSAQSLPTPGGLMPSTKVIQVPSGAFLREDGNRTYILINGTCIGVTINPAPTPVPVPRVCHCPMIPAQTGSPSPTISPGADGLCNCP